MSGELKLGLVIKIAAGFEVVNKERVARSSEMRFGILRKPLERDAKANTCSFAMWRGHKDMFASSNLDSLMTIPKRHPKPSDTSSLLADCNA